MKPENKLVVLAVIVGLLTILTFFVALTVVHTVVTSLLCAVVVLIALCLISLVFVPGIRRQIRRAESTIDWREDFKGVFSNLNTHIDDQGSVRSQMYKIGQLIYRTLENQAQSGDLFLTPVYTEYFPEYLGLAKHLLSITQNRKVKNRIEFQRIEKLLPDYLALTQERCNLVSLESQALISEVADSYVGIVDKLELSIRASKEREIC